MSELNINGIPVPFPEESPNHSGKAPKIEGIVLHSTGGSYSSAVNWLKSFASGVSAHFVVSRKGEIVQLVSLQHTAWHAGKSNWHGKGGCNQFCVGIEQEHIDGKNDWTPAQIKAVAGLCKALMQKLPAITIANIVGHCDICLPHGRKVDPKGFPWEDFRKLVV